MSSCLAFWARCVRPRSELATARVSVSARMPMCARARATRDRRRGTPPRPHRSGRGGAGGRATSARTQAFSCFDALVGARQLMDHRRHLAPAQPRSSRLAARRSSIRASLAARRVCSARLRRPPLRPSASRSATSRRMRASWLRAIRCHLLAQFTSMLVPFGNWADRRTSKSPEPASENSSRVAERRVCLEHSEQMLARRHYCQA